MPYGEKTKLLWQNPKYRAMMMVNHNFIGGWNKIENWKNCLQCGVRFRKPPSAKARFCSKLCGNESRYKDNVGYSALHKWVYGKLGKANKCEQGEDCKGRFQWANISGEYKRERNDWIKMCERHHYEMDNIYKKAWITKRKNASIK